MREARLGSPDWGSAGTRVWSVISCRVFTASLSSPEICLDIFRAFLVTVIQYFSALKKIILKKRQSNICS